MGAVGGLLGIGGGAGGTGFNTPSGTNAQQLQTAYQGNQNAMNQQQQLLGALQGQNGLGNQTQNYNQLQGVISGQGPNPAQAMLNQATGANVANQAALMAGQRGASANPGLMARQAAQQGANLQQQAAGQGASMQAQQALGALGQAGNMANQMAGQQIGQVNQNAASQQNEQNILQGANTASNAVQGQLANTTLGNQANVLGGIGNIVGGVTGLFKAEGGMIPNYANGGAAGPQSMFGQALLPVQQSGIPQFSSPSGSNPFEKWGKQTKKSDPMAQANAGLPAAQNQFNQMTQGPLIQSTGQSQMNPMAAGGGKVPAMVSPGERFLKPAEAKAVAEGKVDPQSVGEKIPGKAHVKGDSYKNDVVKKDLDVGGIVLPRSVENHKHAGWEAKKFVDAIMAKKRMS